MLNALLPCIRWEPASVLHWSGTCGTRSFLLWLWKEWFSSSSQSLSSTVSSVNPSKQHDFLKQIALYELLMNYVLEDLSDGLIIFHRSLSASWVRSERKMRMWPERGRESWVELDRETFLNSDNSLRSAEILCWWSQTSTLIFQNLGK